MMELNTPINELPRIGSSLTKAFKKLEIHTVKDLLFYFPYKYLDFSVFSSIAAIKPNETVTVRGVIKTIQSRFSFKSRLSLCEAVVSDTTGSIKVVWFNQGYISNYLKPGDEVLLSGKAEVYKNLQLQNPIYEKVVADTESIHTGRIVPVYHMTENLYNRTLQTFIKKYVGLASLLVDPLPMSLQRRYDLIPLATAIEQLHFPDSEKMLEQARKRMIFDEVFVQQLAVEQHKQIRKNSPAPTIYADVELIKKFLASLPFALTGDQKKAVWQIVQDMEHKHPMNRLLQGDVGSGKTIVALIASLVAASQDFQIALLAPTEILAKQHYDSFLEYIANSLGNKTTVGLLTHHFHEVNKKNTTKAALLTSIHKGKPSILIGTHAILNEQLQFKNLGLVIIDEQHRFGVEQRALLLKKEISPHLLSMSATPIPRTLALSWYDDLDVSILHEMPKGRQKITTSIVEETQRHEAYTFIKNEIATGRQVFIITPRVEDSETSAVKSVKKEYERLSETIFPGTPMALLYGKMKGADKDKTMGDFAAGRTKILVATSVIEIGIDIPNATVMLIEGAEHFGLAQLHQLRGRVGRGAFESRCFLFTDAADPKSIERLQVFAQTTDGFKLAELDLRQRGFGSLFGDEQTGFNFKFSSFLTLTILKIAKQAARELIAVGPLLKTAPLLQEKVAPLVSKLHLE